MSLKLIMPIAITIASLTTYYIYEKAKESNINKDIPKVVLFEKEKDKKIETKNNKTIEETIEREESRKEKIKYNTLEQQLLYDNKNKIYKNNTSNISEAIGKIIRKELTKRYKNKSLYLDYNFEIKFIYYPNRDIQIINIDSSNIIKNKKNYIRMMEVLKYKFPTTLEPVKMKHTYTTREK